MARSTDPKIPVTAAVPAPVKARGPAVKSAGAAAEALCASNDIRVGIPELKVPELSEVGLALVGFEPAVFVALEVLQVLVVPLPNTPAPLPQTRVCAVEPVPGASLAELEAACEPSQFEVVPVPNTPTPVPQTSVAALGLAFASELSKPLEPSTLAELTGAGDEDREPEHEAPVPLPNTPTPLPQSPVCAVGLTVAFGATETGGGVITTSADALPAPARSNPPAIAMGRNAPTTYRLIRPRGRSREELGSWSCFRCNIGDSSDWGRPTGRSGSPPRERRPPRKRTRAPGRYGKIRIFPLRVRFHHPA